MGLAWRQRRGPAAWLLTLLIVAGTACGGQMTPPPTVVDIRFSRSARNPAALEALTDRIVLRVYGEGLAQAVERTLEPESQLVSLTLPAGAKDLVATAWTGQRLLAEGQAGLTVRPGKTQEVIINLQPVSDPPAGLQSVVFTAQRQATPRFP